MRISEIQQEPKILKTQKGSIIKRNTKLGVGKEMGGFIYIHKLYSSLLPHISLYINMLKEAYPEFIYNIIKYGINNGTVSFLYSPNFDTVEEPIITDYVTVNNTGKAKKGKTRTIYHHKWTMVKDDYPGFNVNQSFLRSKHWLNIPNINVNRIGSSKEYWDNFLKLNRSHLPRDFKFSPEPEAKSCYYTGEPLETGQTSTNFPVAPAIIWMEKNNIIQQGTTVLDYGAGKYARNSNYLRSNNIKTYAYDPFNGENTNGWSGVSSTLPNNKFDTVFSSFVLNVVPKHIEEQIIKDCESRGNSIIHIVRNTDIKTTVKNALLKKDKLVWDFFNNYFLKDCNLKNTEINDEIIDLFCKYGVQTSKGFQRVCYLEEYGYEMIRGSYSSSYKIYAKL